MKAPRVHMLAGLEPVGRQGRVRAWCVCGWVTTPRVSGDRALDARANEHGCSDPVCARCGRNREDLWGFSADRYEHLQLLVGGQPVRDVLAKVIAAVRDDDLWQAWRGQEQQLVCSDDLEVCGRLTESRARLRLVATDPGRV